MPCLVLQAGRVSIESGNVTVCAVPVLAACPSSDTCPIQGYEGCLEVTGPAQGEPPAQKHWVHWTLDNAAQAGAGASFAVELKATEDDNGVPQVPGWVGLGWSPQGPAHHPPQVCTMQRFALIVVSWHVHCVVQSAATAGRQCSVRAHQRHRQVCLQACRRSWQV